jgi:hypothetical protein
MKLPNSDSAYIPQPKLMEYLLSPTHPEGGPKAVFFNQVGYFKDNAHELSTILLDIAKANEVTTHILNEFGDKYIIEGILPRTNDKGIPLRTVWVIDKGEVNPRFVTAYPL